MTFDRIFKYFNYTKEKLQLHAMLLIRAKVGITITMRFLDWTIKPSIACKDMKLSIDWTEERKMMKITLKREFEGMKMINKNK